MGKDGIDFLKMTGFASYGGEFGFWLVGEQGALLVRDGILGKSVFSWCVRVGDADGLPAADRVAHLLLALREDEEGFATIANLNFSGRRMAGAAAPEGRPALGGQSEFAVALGLGDDGRGEAADRFERLLVAKRPVGVEGVVGERERDFGVDDSRPG